MLSFPTIFLLSTLASLSLAESFNLYAYGDEIGGFPLYYSEGTAVVSKNKPENTTAVSFTKSNGGLVGNPNATSSSTDPSFSDAVLFIPGPDSTSHEIGFVNDTDSNKRSDGSEVTTSFVWYGHSLFVEDEAGEMTSLFSIKKSDLGGQYSLLWNVTEEEVITIGIRSVAPSN
ncbi:hypothetical protein BJX99DRAFT_240630 [Aspergillus californicus]